MSQNTGSFAYFWSSKPPRSTQTQGGGGRDGIILQRSLGEVKNLMSPLIAGDEITSE